MQIMVTGSRHYTDRAAVARALASYFPAYDGQPFVVLHGGATGADTFAGDFAERHEGMRTRSFPADWQRFGRAAGPLRTRRMVDELAQEDPRSCVVLAFGTGRGTEFAVREAERRGITVRRFA